MAKKNDIKVSSKNAELINTEPLIVSHSWRVCPYGEHWVITHQMNVPPSEKNPVGSITTRKGHCARNPSGKDQIYLDEIKLISENHFKNLLIKPCPIKWKFKNGNDFDDLIAGWTQYWNEVLKPKIPLDPNLVKALIASESGFQSDILAKKSDPKSARGLMQVTNVARIALGNEKGEIKDHYITLSIEDLNNPANNICAGVRWLFQKQKLATGHLGHYADWIETIKDYKGLKNKSDKEASKYIDILSKYLGDLTQCKSN